MSKRRLKRANGISKLPGNRPVEIPEWWKDMLKTQENYNECLICGNNIKRPNRLYCCNLCRNIADNYTNYKHVNTIRRRIHYKFNFKCQDCGMNFIYMTKIGYVLPAFIGEVHHIIPLGWGHGGEDHFDNLTLLCEHCHKKAHKILKEKRLARYNEKTY